MQTVKDQIKFPYPSEWITDFKKDWYSDNEGRGLTKKRVDELWAETERVCHMVYAYQRKAFELNNAAILSLLSQSAGPGGQSEGAPIKLSAGSHDGGDRFLTQEVFNRMYTHYSDLCDKEDTNTWWENQFYMLKAQQQQREWISLEDRLPEERQEVLVYMPRFASSISVNFILVNDDGSKYWFNPQWIKHNLKEATHWQPLPTPPTPQDPADNQK